MKIDNNKVISDIQQEFSSLFPGLRIEFYSQKHKPREGSHAKTQLDSSSKLSEVRDSTESGEFTITPEMTVAELETLFEDRFGLHAQVFRQSGRLWLQTTATDNWTLEVQNRKGIHSFEAVQ